MIKAQDTIFESKKLFLNNKFDNIPPKLKEDDTDDSKLSQDITEPNDNIDTDDENIENDGYDFNDVIINIDDEEPFIIKDKKTLKNEAKAKEKKDKEEAKAKKEEAKAKEIALKEETNSKIKADFDKFKKDLDYNDEYLNDDNDDINKTSIVYNKHFYEKINIKKLSYIINNFNLYESIINENEKEMRRLDKNYNAFIVLQKIKDNVVIPEYLKNTEFGLIQVSYNKGRNSNGIGRWYAKNGVGLQPLCSCVRSTICKDIWLDIDQVNSHPTIFKHLMNKLGFTSELLNECLNDRENFLKKVMKDEKCSRDIAKTLVIAIINGAHYTSNTLKALSNELKPAINHIINLPEYSSILEFVKKTYKDDKNIEGKTISRILQIIENDLLELYLDFFNSKGLIVNNNQVSLIFDGLQLLVNDDINDDLLKECSKFTFDKTGFNIELKIKLFNNCLNLPENYNEFDDDIIGLIGKYNNKLSNFINNFKDDIEISITEMGSHKSISNVVKECFKEVIVFDNINNSWFYCNINNIWKKSKSPFILKGLISSVISRLYNRYSLTFENQLKAEKSKKQSNPYIIDFLETKIKNINKIALILHNNSFINNIVEISQVDFNKDKFFENKIDCNGNLFSFNNKLFDFNTNTLRDILPNDYIMTNTGYNYPENIDENANEILMNFFKTIYPNDEIREYVLNTFSMMLNGNRTSQSFNIFCGSGSNAKSLLFKTIEGILGNYYLEINAETLTKAKKDANSTGELHLAKGKRCVCSNEPESDKDNKLQTGLLKKLAGVGGKEKLKERALYSEAIEFTIHFILFILCNSKPTLSSVDGGIGRRLRVINHPVKFVDEPDVNNQNQVKKNEEMYKIMGSNEIRNAFILMLINRWINITSKIKILTVPKKINDDGIEYIESSNEVLGFIMDKYEITNNERDKIQSSTLFVDFKRLFNGSKITSSKFKEDMLEISGITFTKTGGYQYFRGLKQKSYDIEEVEED